MELKFYNNLFVEPLSNHSFPFAFMTHKAWDDYGFKTSYSLTVFDEDRHPHSLGMVSIGFFGQKEGKTDIPPEFTQLDQKFFSLGRDVEYYQKIQSFSPELKKLLLVGLNDIVNNQELLSRALKEEVTKKSLLRSVSISSVTGQFRRLLAGGSELTPYYFQYDTPKSRNVAQLSLKFRVIPDANPPSNIHVLIGRNGIGKTHLLNSMAKALVDKKLPNVPKGEFKALTSNNAEIESSDDVFSGLISVSFSAFDPFEAYPEQKDKTEGIRYSYVGLKRSTNIGGKRGTPMSVDMLTNEFVNSLTACFLLGKFDRWKKAVETLDFDQGLNEIGLEDLMAVDHQVVNSNESLKILEKYARFMFKRMSSGYAIVLLTITKLIEKVEEKTLVLIDEPEGHLHPPLLSAFIRVLSDLLTHRNGVAIIATHSPVVLQEVPKHCIWKLQRSGMIAKAERPQIETFGENVGTLTHEVFGLEVMRSGYHQLLKQVLDLNDNKNYEYIVNEEFKGRLGFEAKAILRGLLAEKAKKLEQEA